MLKLITSYINDNYGSRRGLLNAVRSQVLYGVGSYRAWSVVDWTRVERLVFVCHGNICRSPLAEGWARHLGAKAESCGLSCRNGAEADERALRYAAQIGINLGAHRSRHISLLQPAAGDLFVVMEPVHLQGLPAAVLDTAQVTLAGLWLPRPNPYIHDPYSAGERFFSKCEGLVVAAAECLAANMVPQSEQWKGFTR